MNQYSVEFYETDDGSKPAKEFILSQPIKMKAKLFGMLKLLEDYGIQLREPYSKLLEDGIFELRCKQGTDITRVLYFFYQNGRIILTNGFVKKTQKTPSNEIVIAKNRRDTFLAKEGLK